MAKPILSFPRLPARPYICRSSSGRSMAGLPAASYWRSAIITLRIEKFTPAPSPVVATTTFRSPSRAYFSTTSARWNAESPLWWKATLLRIICESSLPAASDILRGRVKKFSHGSSAASVLAIDSASARRGAKIKRGAISDSITLWASLAHMLLSPFARTSGRAVETISSRGTARMLCETSAAVRPILFSHAVISHVFSTLPLISSRRVFRGDIAIASS